MTAITWSGLQSAVAAALVQAPSPYTSLPPDFTTLFPIATSYAESRICTEIVLLNTRTEDTSLSTTANTRTLSLAGMSKPVIVQEGFGLVASGVTYSYDKTTLDVIDLIWPQSSLTLAPSAADWIGRYWAPLNDSTIVIAPTPDAAYVATVTGLFQPTPMSSGNPTTYISTVYPDLLFAAVMQHLTGSLLRNFGSQADEPKIAQSWENEFQTLLGPAKAEERRRRGLAPDDTPMQQAKA